MANRIEIAEAIVPIIPSAKGINGKIEKELSGELSNAGVSGGNALGQQLVGTLKKVIVAAGIGKAIQAAMSEGAKLQQSYGGLDTIYGEASEAAKQYAQEAYKAGISANDYAEQAVSFGASLKQAFGGDTTKAVEAANTAIMDMTDNAAKMGTPLESIQNAYQGFAKGNYTMLDNLKLGYGGTKTEMERLLADAEKLTGVKYDISNLGDVYEAIHVIQGELGLTGVAADEAAGTFSGSMGAMKAALSNFLGALATGGDVTTSLQALIGNASVFLQNNLLPMLGSIITAIPTVIQAAVPALLTAAQDLLTQLSGIFNIQSLQMGVDTIMNLVNGFMEQLPQLLETGTELARGLIEGLLTAIPEIVTAAAELVTGLISAWFDARPEIFSNGHDLIVEFVNGLMDAAPEVITTVGEMITNMVSTILENAPAFMEQGANYILQMISGITSRLPDIVSSIGQLIGQLLQTIVSHLPEILAKGVEIVGKLVEGLIQAIPKIVAAIPQLIAAIVKGFTGKDWKTVGSDIISGIARGITDGIGALKDAVKDAANRALEAAKNFLGIASPSKVFRDQVGAMMAEGMAIGFEDNVPTAEIEQALRPMTNIVPETMSNQYSYGGFSINVYGAPGQSEQELADIVMSRINQAVNSRQAVFA